MSPNGSKGTLAMKPMLGEDLPLAPKVGIRLPTNCYNCCPTLMWPRRSNGRQLQARDTRKCVPWANLHNIKGCRPSVVNIS
jgi:hypothetical protein